MTNCIFTHGKWIVPEEFKDIAPIDVFHRQQEKVDIELPAELKHRHMLVRKTFTLENVENTRIRITADDYYKLHINGKFVCQGPAQGYWFSYYWNETDITDYLREGENEIFVDVYYQGLINRAYNSGDRRMGMIAELLCGETCILSTDETWEYTMSGAYTIGKTIGYDTMFAENVDSRWKPERWQTCFTKDVDYTFSPAPVKTVQVYEKSPVHMEKLPTGGILYDFGEEITAALHVFAKGVDGAKVRILCGEELENSPVKVRYDMRCSCVCEEFWTLADGGNELTQYDYRAFRYVALIPTPGVELGEVSAIVRHYPFDDDYCTLETDNEILQSVWQICKNGLKYGAQEVFVDCPLREKGQYAGDLTISSASHIILTGDLSLFQKALDNQMQSVFIDDGVMAVTPGSLMQEIADYSLQFPILVLRNYHYTKDMDYLRRGYEVCDGIVKHFQKYAREDGLIQDVDDKWNLVDWPTMLRDDYDFPLTTVMEPGHGPHNVLNAFYIGCVIQTEEIAKLLGIERENKSDALKEAFHNAFFCPETGLYADSPKTKHCALHSSVVTAFYGINRPEEEQAIRDLIMEKGLCCGVYMAYFLLKALCRMGYYEDAYQLIINESEHGWYNMIREGATTCYEAWGKDQKWNTSLCHPWASAPIPVLAEDILPNLPQVGKLVYKKA